MSHMDMVTQYLATALWSSTDDDGEPLDRDYDIDSIDHETCMEARRDCLDFLNKAKGLLGEARDMEQIGHDFWLTRNRHGAGFWDGDYPIHGERLTEIAHSYGELDPYVDDDGMVRF